MTTFKITVDNEMHATGLKQILKEIRFVKKIESDDDNDELTSEQIQLLEERIALFKKNPRKGKSLDQFKAEMKMKYGI